MASHPPSACCIKSIFHEGQAVGQHEIICGLDTYVAGKANARTVVILTDIYGHKFNNVMLVADQLAKLGNFRVLIPDILEGDPVPTTHGDLAPWLAKHNLERTKPIVDRFMKSLREEMGANLFIGVIGYCFGAKYAIQQIASDGYADNAAVAHPSFVTIEEVEAIKKPLLISAAEVDELFPPEMRHKTEASLAKIGARYQLDLFSGVTHGWAMKGDPKDPVVNYAMNKTLADQIHWFNHV